MTGNRKSFYLFYSLALILLFNFSTYAQQATKSATTTYQTQINQHKIDSSIAEDKALTEMLAPYSVDIKKQMETVIGQAPETINKEGAGAGRLGMLMTDIIRKQASLALGKSIDLAFQNNGGIRAEIPAGEITLGTIYRLMPFDNQVAVIELSGKDLMELFESMAPSIKDFGAAIAGAQLTYQDKKLVSAKINEKDIDINATYTLALTDYLYNGGGEYPILRRGQKYQTCNLLLRDAIINHIKTEQAEKRSIVAPSKPRVSLTNAQ
ncbi:MAG: 5'-nucleotidase C-terminal domain-containing protein [Acidobacteria bacterium]|nr:5'-nucleotidase C-terminal domain-containing protein [Acidobacteriota bacterium]